MKTLKISNSKKRILIDDKNFDLLSKFTWVVCGKGGSVKANVLGKNNVSIAWLVLGQPPKGKEVDHINRNPLDNREINLRFCSKSQNQMNKGLQKNNTSGYKGVHKSKNRKRWKAELKHNGKRLYLGTYNTKEEAAKVYNETAKKYYGEFAWLNPV